MSVPDCKSIKLPKQHCAFPARTLFPTNLVPRADVSICQQLNTDFVSKLRGQLRVFVSSWCWPKDTWALTTRLFSVSSFLVVTLSAYTTFNKSSTGDENDFLKFIRVSIFEKRDSFLDHWNESKFCETSDDHGGLVSCLVFQSRLVLKSTGLPETLSDPMILHNLNFLQGGDIGAVPCQNCVCYIRINEVTINLLKLLYRQVMS